MYDVATMKYVNDILERAETAAPREAEKAASVGGEGGISWALLRSIIPILKMRSKPLHYEETGRESW